MRGPAPGGAFRAALFCARDISTAAYQPGLRTRKPGSDAGPDGPNPGRRGHSDCGTADAARAEASRLQPSRHTAGDFACRRPAAPVFWQTWRNFGKSADRNRFQSPRQAPAYPSGAAGPSHPRGLPTAGVPASPGRGRAVPLWVWTSGSADTIARAPPGRPPRSARGRRFRRAARPLRRRRGQRGPRTCRRRSFRSRTTDFSP